MGVKVDQPSSLLRLKEVTHHFGGIPAVEEVQLDIRSGDFVALLGPSGCGKSTLLRIAAGLIHPSRGEVSGEEARRAFVFQDACLMPWRRVEENVLLPLELSREYGPDSPELARRCLEMVGLPGTSSLYPRELSGGMAMRVSLARALITRPRLLFMDEPFGALDELTRQHLNNFLNQLWADQGWTCLFVTHNVMEAVFLATRVLVLAPRPTHIVAEIPIPLPRLRPEELREDREYLHLVAEVTRQLRQANRREGT